MNHWVWLIMFLCGCIMFIGGNEALYGRQGYEQKGGTVGAGDPGDTHLPNGFEAVLNFVWEFGLFIGLMGLFGAYFVVKRANREV